MNSKPPVLPDFDHCLVNLANSILQNFGAETTAPTLSMARDEVIKYGVFGRRRKNMRSRF